MSHDVNWDVEKYKEEHESEDQWELRKAFLLKWKDNYPEERLVCLARVFTNIEFMGCTYPPELMREVAQLSVEVAKQYRNDRKTKLHRTFVPCSQAAEDRVRGVKRQGGVIVSSSQKKSAKIAFVPQGHNSVIQQNEEVETNNDVEVLLQRIQAQPQIKPATEINNSVLNSNETSIPTNGNVDITTATDLSRINYLEELSNMESLDPRDFEDGMMNNAFGNFVLIIRPWCNMINNLQSTCAIHKISLKQAYKCGVYTMILSNQVLVNIRGSKHNARATACRIIWDKLRHCSVMLVFKEQWVAQTDSLISANDMAEKKHDFGEPIAESVALKMMKLMGWKGGGLGADSQGISEPIKPHLRMIRRAGLGHEGSSGLEALKRAAFTLMRRRRITLDADLVFASDFTADERAVLHKCANQCGLMSKSYGKGDDRFLVVSNKLKPLALLREVLACGGDTPKYRVFIPASIYSSNIGTANINEK